jgi:branched-chain amino acid transport system ATP-binding protein
MNAYLRHTLEHETVLSIAGLSAGYGDLDILRDVDLTVVAGVTTVIGPNGAGKSTLLKAIFGIANVTKGIIRLGDIDLRRLSNRNLLRAGVAFVPQGRCNFPRMTVHENLEMGSFTLPRREARLAISSIYDRFTLLSEKRAQLAGELSGGQQQILEMAMALVTNPRLLLIDEPSLGLAPLTLTAVLDEVKRISIQGVTVLMVEQNAKQALARSDRGVVLELGRKALEGVGIEMLSDSRLAELYLGGSGVSAGTSIDG